MPTIFAIDGAEDSFYGFGELGAYSSSVASLQTALIALGQKVGDGTLSALVLDGLIGPKTTAAANRAFAMYVSGAPANFATGTLSQSQVSTNASSLASYVNAELSRRGGAKTTALVPAAAAPAAVAVRAAPAVSDSSTQIVKWASIGLGGVVVASVLYLLWKRQQGRPMLRGCDLGVDWKPYSHHEVTKMAKNRWEPVWSVEEVDTRPGTVIRRTEGPLAKYRGQRVEQQFKVRLHSSTGPLHWIAIREDGTPLFS
jgi:peptidoglycan hydrolase-like protein with peptidoglycan-binding domain